MTETDTYRRFERVEAVEETPHGVLASLHGERLRLDVVRADTVRVKISRGGVFDEAAHASRCASTRWRRRPDFTVERDDDAVRVRTADLVVTLWLDPFRLDVHRADGSAVVETAQDAEGRYWAYATLNDAFTLRRSVPPGGRRLRPGGEDRSPQPQGPGLHAVEHRRAQTPTRPGSSPVGGPRATRARERTSTEFDPYYVSIPFFYHQSYPAGTMAGLVRRQRLPRRRTSSRRPEEYRIHFAGGQYTEYIFAGPRMPDILTAYTWLTGRTAPAAAVVPRLPPVPLVRLHPGRGRGARAAPPRRRHPVRRPVARHRVHGRLPRLHVEHARPSRTRREC